MFLKKRGYKATFTHNLKEGLKLLNRIKPKVLFLDNHLPDGRGWEQAPKLRAGFPDMIINFVSAFNDNSSHLLLLDPNIKD
ncbi:MAG: response regulator [Ginsengibacter sp.]